MASIASTLNEAALDCSATLISVTVFVAMRISKIHRIGQSRVHRDFTNPQKKLKPTQGLIFLGSASEG